MDDGADEDDGGYDVKAVLSECAVFECGHEVHFARLGFLLFV